MAFPIALGDPSYPFPPYDTFDSMGNPNGLSAALVVASFFKSGLTPQCDYQITIGSYTGLGTGILSSVYGLVGVGFLSKYYVASTSWAVTDTRHVVAYPGIPFSNDTVQAQIVTVGDASECPTETGDAPKIGYIAGFTLTAKDLANAPAPYNDPSLGVPIPSQDPDVLKQLFADGKINSLLTFATTPVMEDGVAITTPCTKPYDTGIPTYGPIFNKGSPEGIRLLRAYNEGLRQLVCSGEYAKIIRAYAPDLTPWTKASFPRLKCSRKRDKTLISLLGYKELYTQCPEEDKQDTEECSKHSCGVVDCPYH